jgi:hypothetical protein
MQFFEISDEPSSEVISLLTNNVIGTPDSGMLYQHTFVEKKIRKIPDPTFVSLIRQKRVLGTCCFCRRISYDRGHAKPAFYLRYFSFRAAYRRVSSQTNARNYRGVLAEEISGFLEGKSLGLLENDKFFHYAYYDPANIRSVLFCRQFGFEEVRSFSTFMFTRIFNRAKKKFNFEELQVDERCSIAGMLRSFYDGYNMYCEENLFLHGKYYVARDPNGKIMAGVQVNPDLWRIHSLPGKTGRILIRALSEIPLVNSIINQHFRFLALEAVYCEAGEEDKLQSLIEAVLHLFSHHVALAFADSDSRLSQLLRKIDAGFFSRLNKETQGKVICRFQNFSGDEKTFIKESPAYISAIDVT